MSSKFSWYIDRYVMHARHSFSIKPNTLRFFAGVWKGGSLRITRTLIWLFYPLACQRTKCIDSSVIAPHVSGMYFIHPTVKHSALWSSCYWSNIPGHKEERGTREGIKFQGWKGNRKPISLSVHPSPIWNTHDAWERRTDAEVRGQMDSGCFSPL